MAWRKPSLNPIARNLAAEGSDEAGRTTTPSSKRTANLLGVLQLPSRLLERCGKSPIIPSPYHSVMESCIFALVLQSTPQWRGHLLKLNLRVPLVAREARTDSLRNIKSNRREMQKGSDRETF
ncbi:hypothetical protein RJZ56_005889 [Blastomyces dermatitidis]